MRTNMKKIYSKPVTSTIVVQLSHMVAISVVQGTANDSDALSRNRQDVWEEDEEE
jgi:hypothetical protein